MSSVNLAFSTLKKFCVLVPVIGDGVSFSSTDIVMPVRNNVCTVTQKSFFLLCFYSIQGTDLNYTYKNLSPPACGITSVSLLLCLYWQNLSGIRKDCSSVIGNCMRKQLSTVLLKCPGKGDVSYIEGSLAHTTCNLIDCVQMGILILA